MPIPEGTPEWEANLIRQIRLRGYLWNTEQIYRGWLRRFAAALAPLPPDQAGAAEVRDFISDLAVRQQVSAIRTVQDLLWHASVETTQIYTHVMQKPGLGVRSPLNAMGGG